VGDGKHVRRTRLPLFPQRSVHCALVCESAMRRPVCLDANECEQSMPHTTLHYSCDAAHGAQHTEATWPSFVCEGMMIVQESGISLQKQVT
jgi:hypothetical protein